MKADCGQVDGESGRKVKSQKWEDRGRWKITKDEPEEKARQVGSVQMVVLMLVTRQQMMAETLTILVMRRYLEGEEEDVGDKLTREAGRLRNLYLILRREGEC